MLVWLVNVCKALLKKESAGEGLSISSIRNYSIHFMITSPGYKCHPFQLFGCVLVLTITQFIPGECFCLLLGSPWGPRPVTAPWDPPEFSPSDTAESLGKLLEQTSLKNSQQSPHFLFLSLQILSAHLVPGLMWNAENISANTTDKILALKEVLFLWLNYCKEDTFAGRLLECLKGSKEFPVTADQWAMPKERK